MLIYEKDNKLNINFENNVEETPDLQISKSGDKTEVLIDGQQGGGGSGGGTLVVNVLTLDAETMQCTVDKTVQEVVEASSNHQNIICILDRRVTGGGDTILYMPLYSVQFLQNNSFGIMFSSFNGTYIQSVTANKDIGDKYVWSFEEFLLNG